jgi:nucleotide-binding universal stress UspA family protein
MEGIVVGVDGSDASREALRWAIEEGRLRQAPVVAVHGWLPPVLPLPADATVLPPPDLPGLVAQTEDAAQRLVERVAEEVAGGQSDVDVRPVALEGPAASVLVAAAAGAELVVVGSRGLGGFRTLLLGSVSHHVAQHAPCPVVIHRAARRD